MFLLVSSSAAARITKAYLGASPVCSVSAEVRSPLLNKPLRSTTDSSPTASLQLQAPPVTSAWATPTTEVQVTPSSSRRSPHYLKARRITASDWWASTSVGVNCQFRLQYFRLRGQSSTRGRSSRASQPQRTQRCGTHFEKR